MKKNAIAHVVESMKPICDNCEQARTQKHWAIYQADCHGCKVRAVANGPELFGALVHKVITVNYRSVLQANFGNDWKAAHEEVKSERKRLEAMK